jgi:hypothetical protein
MAVAREGAVQVNARVSGFSRFVEVYPRETRVTYR